MLYPAEALLFGRSNELAVADERGSGIAMERIEAKNDHLPVGVPYNRLRTCMFALTSNVSGLYRAVNGKVVALSAHQRLDSRLHGIIAKRYGNVGLCLSELQRARDVHPPTHPNCL